MFPASRSIRGKRDGRENLDMDLQRKGNKLDGDPLFLRTRRKNYANDLGGPALELSFGEGEGHVPLSPLRLL